MPKDWVVTPHIRSLHFDKHGYMAKDSEILTWYKGNLIETQERKKQKKESK